MLAKFSVRKPITVVVAVLAILILGWVSFGKMTTDLLPGIDLPYAIVMTTYIGASPEQVETVVSKPIEQSMATLSSIHKISSISSENRSMVILQFNDSTNMDYVTVDIREKLDLISAYWDDSVGAPIIMKLNPDMLPVMVMAVDAEGMDMPAISEYADSTVIPALEGVEGVAGVNATGLIEESIHVVLNQQKIDAVNQRIQAAIEQTMTEAEKELSDARKELADGQKELETQNKEFQDGMIAADQGLEDARLELVQRELQLSDGEKELADQEAEFKARESEFYRKKTEAATAQTELDQKEAELKSGQTVLKTKKTELKAALAAAKTEEEKAVIESGLMETEVLLEQAAEGLKQLADAQKQLAAGAVELKAAEAQLTQARGGLEAAKKQLADGRTALTAAKEALKANEAELEKQKSEVGSQLSSALDEVSAGSKELDQKANEFDSSRQSAVDGAKIDGVLTADRITQILQAQNFSMPAGYVEEDGISYLVRVGDKLQSVEELSKLVLFDTGVEGVGAVKLEEVADVYKTDNSAATYAKVNGNNAVILSIEKQTNYSTSDVTERIKEKMKTLEEQKEGLHSTELMDQGVYIELVVDSVLSNLIFGGILAIIILFFFLWDLKPTFIIACSIPISVVFAIVLMYFSGVTLNIISLSGLAVGVGMLVDNSVVVIENIYRLRSKGLSAVKSAVSGAVQVAGAITSSTLTTVCVFVPIVFVEGMTRQLFMDMALTIAYSLLASLVIALTLVPAMSAGMLKKQKDKRHPLFDKFADGYETSLSLALRFKPVVLILALGLLVLSIFGAMSNGTAYMPEMDSTQLSVSVTMPEDTAFIDTTKMCDTVMERIRSIEDVDKVGAMIGSSGMAGMGGGSSDAVSMYVLLKEDKRGSSKEIAAQINELCADLNAEVTADSSSMDMGSLGETGVQVHLYGNDLNGLIEQARKLADIMGNVEGIAQVSDGIEDPVPEISISVKKSAAAVNGLTVAQIYAELQKQLAEAGTATTITEEAGAAGTDTKVTVEKSGESKLTVDELKQYTFSLTGKDGEVKEVRLSDLAQITERDSMSSIRRDAQRRYVTVSAELADGYNIGKVSTEVEKAVKAYQLPSGFELEFAGENATIMDAMGQLVQMLLLGVALIYFIMAAQFQSFVSPFIVMFTIPLAFTGGFLGLFFTGKEMSVIAVIGFVMLTGIVVNNGIVLIDYINQLRREGAERRDAILEAGRTRLRPILMTALTTVLGLSTMAFGMGMGSDMVQPIAIVTIGGLLYATVTTLFVIPAVYEIVTRKNMRVVDESELEVSDE